MQTLWIAVIVKAILDTKVTSGKSEKQIAKKEATEWLFAENPHFVTVCSLAGLHPERVRKLAKRALNGRIKRNDHFSSLTSAREHLPRYQKAASPVSPAEKLLTQTLIGEQYDLF